MKDSDIIRLYFERSESAVEETSQKYGGLCYSIAFNVLASDEDANECVNDAYLAAWNSIPPEKPSSLGAFLGKITRRLSIDRWRSKRSQKRGGGQVDSALEELEQCIPDSGGDPQQQAEYKELVQAIGRFVKGLSSSQQKVFICRYWYLDSISGIAERTGFSETKVRSMLFRTRNKLREMLSKEGFI